MSFLTLLFLLALVPVAWAILRYPVVGGTLMLFVLYTRISDVGITFHGLPSIAQPLVLVLAAVTFLRRTLQGGARSLAAEAFLWTAMVLYLAVTLASAIWARNPSAATTEASDLAKNLLILYVIVEIFETSRAVRLGIWSLIGAGVLLAGLSVMQAATHTYGNSYLGLAQAPIRQITAEYNGFRSSGPIGDPNFYGLILAALVPLALLRLRDERALFLRLAALAAALLLTAGVILTYSRGALVALLAMLVLYVLLGGVRRRHLVIAALLLLPLASLVPGTYWQRATTLATGATDNSVQKRIDSQQVAMAIFADNPITGVGAGNYNVTYFPYALRLNVPSAAGYAHDFYLQLLSENGLLGMCTFGAAMLLALMAAWRRREEALRAGDRAVEGLVTAGMLSVLTYLIGIVFLPAAYPRYLWVLLGVAMSASLLGRQAAAARRVPRVLAVEIAG